MLPASELRGEDPDLTLLAAAPENSYLDGSGILHHVNGEHWLWRYKIGPNKTFDQYLKANFEVGVLSLIHI